MFVWAATLLRYSSKLNAFFVVPLIPGPQATLQTGSSEELNSAVVLFIRTHLPLCHGESVLALRVLAFCYNLSDVYSSQEQQAPGSSLLAKVLRCLLALSAWL